MLALHAAALPAARAWTTALAMGCFLLGFALDDARWAPVPGFALGSGAAVLALGLGSPLFAWALARRLARRPLEDAHRALRWHTLGARLAAVAVVGSFVAWLLLTTGEVLPWMA